MMKCLQKVGRDSISLAVLCMLISLATELTQKVLFPYRKNKKKNEDLVCVISLSVLLSLSCVLGEGGSLTATYVPLVKAVSATSYLLLQHLWPFCDFPQAGV